MSVWEKIRGTSEVLWQIGLGGLNLKNNGGVFEARDAADAAFVVARGATPVAANDLTTKAYVDAAVPTGTIREVRDTLALVTLSSTNQIPANAIVSECVVDITTAYTAGTTISVGITGTPTLFQLTTDNLATAIGSYVVPLDVTVGASAANVLITVAGSPAVGAAAIAVKYSTIIS